MQLRQLRPGEEAQCEQILRSLPDWFGIESSILEYREAARTMDTVVLEENSVIIGFMTLNRHNPLSGEIHVMGVRPEYHRQGAGKRLVEYATGTLKTEGIRLLQVKTLGASHPSPHYAATRRFYAAQGFLPLEETDLWGETNPCLIMVMCLNEHQ